MAGDIVCFEIDLLTSRIQGLQQTCKIIFEGLSIRSEDSYGSLKLLLNEIEELLSCLSTFSNNFETFLPSHFLKKHQEIQDKFPGLKKQANSSSDAVASGSQAVMWALAQLSAVANILSYDLKNSQIFIKSKVEIAFHHLQYCIIANDSVKNDWNYKIHDEPSFEKLGAAHLLLHNIWAFKANGTVFRTDLILTQPNDDISSNATGLVLTEWKKADQKNVDRKIDEAMQQAIKYSQYALPNELSICRYLIMVSEKYLNISNKEIPDGKNLYKVLNIATSPNTPSKS